MDIKYCIRHGKLEAVFLTDDGKHEYHYINNNAAAICEGPFTETPPPPLPVDWDISDWTAFLSEPSPEELERMNMAARELLADVEVLDEH